MSLSFRRLTVRDWRQFKEVEIEFHPRLTVLTGANGSGKTTLLQLLSPHFAWKPELPGDLGMAEGQVVAHSQIQRHASIVESVNLEYTDASVESLMIISREQAPRQIKWSGEQEVRGIYIPAHRTAPGLNPIEQLPTFFESTDALLGKYLDEVRRWTSSSDVYRKPEKPMLHMKGALMAAAVFSEDTAAIKADEVAHEVWHGFKDVLIRLLPRELNFQRLEVRPPDLVMVTRDGDFSVDAASGGISALLEYAWQIFLEARGNAEFVVCFDEPENHLHPELQRSLLPRLMDAFPQAQFVVSSHSPFVVTSVPDSHLYALSYGDGRVESHLLDRTNKAQAAERTLREVLGLSSTLPLWAERKLEEILDSAAAGSQTPSSIQNLKAELDRAGLSSEFPATIAALARKVEHEEP